VPKERGLRVIGSLGVLIAAKRAGHIMAVGPVIERMVRLGMFVAPSLRDRVLVLADQGPGE
jgi:predicted nucleic acid-binding protein